MKMILLTALLAIAASPALADYYLNGQLRSPCRSLPPEDKRAEPTVPYVVRDHSFEEIQYHCAEKHGITVHQPITACVPRHPAENGVFDIWMPNYLSDEDYACVLLYEKAHLPPNNWQDSAWEDSVTKGVTYDGPVESYVKR